MQLILLIDIFFAHILISSLCVAMANEAVAALKRYLCKTEARVSLCADSSDVAMRILVVAFIVFVPRN